MAEEGGPESRLPDLRFRGRTREPGLPAGELLHARLVEQVDALHEAEPAIREGRPDGVHDARVACRRLRAALATFRPAVRVDVSEPLRGELRWLAQSLGDARDDDVARERLVALAEQEGEVAGLLVEQLTSHDRSQPEDDPVLEVLGSRRYSKLMDTLDAFVLDPPWAAEAQRHARPFLRRRLRKEWNRLEDRVALVSDFEPGTAPDEQLHAVRKAAKRLRYALEVADLLWPSKARRLRKRVHRLTDILGERQDTVVARAALRRAATQAETAGEPTVVHGRLRRLDEARAKELEVEFHRAWSDTVRRRRFWP